MKTVSCLKCGEQYSAKRRALGYTTCLDCGSVAADKEAKRRAKCVAPAFNKGAYQYVGSFEEAKWVGR